jgi:thiol-disulfide isomerase/thioredoxin
MKRVLPVLLVLVLSCSIPCLSRAIEKSAFLNEYESLLAASDGKMAEVKSRDAFEKLMAERKSGLEALLDRHAADPALDQVELLRARILIDLHKYPEAGIKLDALIGKKSPLRAEAWLFKAKSLTETEKIDQAVPLFKRVEAELPRSSDFFEVALALAFEASDEKVRKEYSLKLLAATDLPGKFSEYRYGFVTTLADIEMKKRNIPAAKKILQDGLQAIRDEQGKKNLQSALLQLEFIGKPAPAIAAEKWLNSAPLALGDLKGKVLVIDFWAPWCPPCRKVIPTLAKDFNELKDRGLVVIGFTKLYGSYRDDIQNKGKVGADEEKELIKGFVERNGLQYPVAIAAGGEVFDKYGVSGIPTMVFIDKAGNIYGIKVGSGDEAAITSKIKLLLAEK